MATGNSATRRSCSTCQLGRSPSLTVDDRAGVRPSTSTWCPCRGGGATGLAGTGSAPRGRDQLSARRVVTVARLSRPANVAGRKAFPPLIRPSKSTAVASMLKSAPARRTASPTDLLSSPYGRRARIRRPVPPFDPPGGASGLLPVHHEPDPALAIVPPDKPSAPVPSVPVYRCNLSHLRLGPCHNFVRHPYSVGLRRLSCRFPILGQPILHHKEPGSLIRGKFNLVRLLDLSHTLIGSHLPHWTIALHRRPPYAAELHAGRRSGVASACPDSTAKTTACRRLANDRSQ
jgi:hypothetical protein